MIPKIGIIGGSGLYEIPGMEIAERIEMETPFGSPSDAYLRAEISGKHIYFLPRHGTKHRIHPHKINYRANIWGFQKLGAGRIISIGASGGIDPSRHPGMITVPDQLLDFTTGRESTFYEGEEVVHVDFTNPFCDDLRSYVFSGAEKAGIDVARTGVYICVNGPRLETAAEIRSFSMWGADLVGMTAMPEAVLAREAGICFTIVSVITNFAAGIAETPLTASEVVMCMEASSGKLRKLLKAILSLEFRDRTCGCRQSLDEAIM